MVVLLVCCGRRCEVVDSLSLDSLLRLSLQTWDFVELDQDESYGDITVRLL